VLEIELQSDQIADRREDEQGESGAVHPVAAEEKPGVAGGAVGVIRPVRRQPLQVSLHDEYR